MRLQVGTPLAVGDTFKVRVEDRRKTDPRWSREDFVVTEVDGHGLHRIRSSAEGSKTLLWVFPREALRRRSPATPIPQ